MTASDPLFDIAGRVAIVTGATSGLGERFARVLHGRGAHVVVTGRREARLQALADELGGDRARAMICDVTDESAVVRVVRDTVEAFGHLVAAKTAVVGLTRELGTQWARQGVRVNAIAPGWFPTEMTGQLTDPDHVRWIEERTPMRRAGRLDDLDGALIFLASDASSYVTGQTVVVDGGWTAW